MNSSRTQRLAIGAAADLNRAPAHLGNGSADVRRPWARLLCWVGGIDHGVSSLTGTFFCLDVAEEGAGGGEFPSFVAIHLLGYVRRPWLLPL